MISLSLSIAASLAIGMIVVQAAQAQTPQSEAFPALTNVDAWKLLPREKPPLPAWARIMVETLPKTTAAMLRLDYVHREQSPLGKVLYGKVRWVASNANQCEYTKRYAEADLKRAGVSDEEIKQLAGNWKEMSEIDRLTFSFARKMTLAAYSVTDEEVAQLLKHYGPDKLVALVHTLAHANFQDRIICALGVEVEADGPLAPIDLRLDPEEKAKLVVPPRLPVPENPSAAPILKERPRWIGEDTSGLAKALEHQKERQPRIPLAPMERFAKYPIEVQKRAERIRWGRVSLGYSPLLTQAWYDCMGAFDAEAKLDEVFANTFFWVITRSNQCFY